MWKNMFCRIMPTNLVLLMLSFHACLTSVYDNIAHIGAVLRPVARS